MTRNPVRALIEALAEADGVAPDELDYALYEYIDPDVLKTLASREDESWELTFAVADHRVTLTGSGAIYIDGSLSRVTTHACRDGVTHIDPGSIAAHAHYPDVLDSLLGVVYRCRNERGWPIDFLSGGCRQLTGYDPNAFVVGGVSIGEDVIHPDDRQAVWTQVQEAVQAREPFSLTYRIRTAAGEETQVWEVGRGVFEDGEAVALVGFITANTEWQLVHPQVQRDALD